MITAEDFLQNHQTISHFYDDKTDKMVCFSDDVQKAMIEFAKLHVEVALKQASKVVYIDEYKEFNPICNKESILNSYPLENIK